MNLKKDTARRLPAEWEACEAVLLSWPHEDTDWVYMLEEVEECYINLVKAIAPHARLVIVGPDMDHISSCLTDIPEDRFIICPMPTNDTWTRDFGPITIESNGEMYPVDFKFNGWGLKFASDRDNMATTHLTGYGIFKHEPENELSFVLEGGSIESDGRGTLLTTSACLMSPNRNGGMCREEIEEHLRHVLGVHKILWLNNGHLDGDDTDSHVDTLARFAPPGDVIFYTGCADPSDSHYTGLKAMETELRAMRTPENKPYHLVELPLPDAIYDPADGSRLPATYANFLIINNVVFLPVYNQPLKDKMAADLIATALPDYAVVSVDCRALIRQHGSLHCATMQFPNNTLAI